jgi:hypothetical protein
VTGTTGTPSTNTTAPSTVDSFLYQIYFQWYYGALGYLAPRNGSGGGLGAPPPQKPTKTVRQTITNVAKNVICGEAAPLLLASQITNRTTGTGVGASGGVGFILGVAASVGVQIVADPQGHVGLVVNFGGNPGYGVFGAGALLGAVGSASTARSIEGLGGFSLGVGGNAGALGVDVTESSGGTTLTGTAGLGLGTEGAALSLNYTFVPGNVNCRE